MLCFILFIAVFNVVVLHGTVPYGYRLHMCGPGDFCAYFANDVCKKINLDLDIQVVNLT